MNVVAWIIGLKSKCNVHYRQHSDTTPSEAKGTSRCNRRHALKLLWVDVLQQDAGVSFGTDIGGMRWMVLKLHARRELQRSVSSAGALIHTSFLSTRKGRGAKMLCGRVHVDVAA